MPRTFAIAEAGSCHDGDFAKACALVAEARAAGADAVKFQFWSDADQLADRRRVPVYYREIYRRYQMPAAWLQQLHDYCFSLGIEFMATTYLPQDVATVAPFVQQFKIASFEADSVDLARAHVPFLVGNRTVIVSLGMGANPNTVPRALCCDKSYVGWYSHARFLHCVSAYPAPPEAMSLWLLGDEEWSFVGLSDHSRHPWMGALAVAAGAEVIEAHLRLEETEPTNPDYATAFSPREFADYVANVRFAERARGDGQKRLQDCELEMAAYKVRSVSEQDLRDAAARRSRRKFLS
jgi:N,N'-diacetyllegionaminate synthase